MMIQMKFHGYDHYGNLYIQNYSLDAVILMLCKDRGWGALCMAEVHPRSLDYLYQDDNSYTYQQLGQMQNSHRILRQQRRSDLPYNRGRENLE